jgi:hypothetical protein
MVSTDDDSAAPVIISMHSSNDQYQWLLACCLGGFYFECSNALFNCFICYRDAIHSYPVKGRQIAVGFNIFG